VKAGKVIALLVLIIIGAFLWPQAATDWFSSGKASSASAPAGVGSAQQTWGRIETLEDHFVRHGRDFNARDAEDYAAQASGLLQRARTSGLPAKRAGDGTIRVFDPSTGAFGAYNSDGTTKTFFKPGNPSYFDRQPGERVDLRTVR
jgi:pyocin large subunit-like protein